MRQRRGDLVGNQYALNLYISLQMKVREQMKINSKPHDNTMDREKYDSGLIRAQTDIVKISCCHYSINMRYMRIYRSIDA